MPEMDNAPSQKETYKAVIPRSEYREDRCSTYAMTIELQDKIQVIHMHAEGSYLFPKDKPISAQSKLSVITAEANHPS